VLSASLLNPSIKQRLSSLCGSFSPSFCESVIEETMKGFALLVFAVAIGAAAATAGSSVTFTIKAENLRSHDDHTKPDPYVKIYTYNTANNQAIALERIGKTSTLFDNDSPQWPESFNVPCTAGQGKKIRFNVVDTDLTTTDDAMGFVDIDCDQLLASRTAEYRAPLSDGGVICITKTTPLQFKLNAAALPRKDRYWGYDGPSDPYVEVYYRTSQNAADNFLITTSTIDDTDNPIWPEQIDFPQYLRGSGQYLSFKVYDYDRWSSDDFIGQASVSADDLVERRISNVLSLGAKNVHGSLTVRLN